MFVRFSNEFVGTKEKSGMRRQTGDAKNKETSWVKRMNDIECKRRERGYSKLVVVREKEKKREFKVLIENSQNEQAGDDRFNTRTIKLVRIVDCSTFVFTILCLQYLFTSNNLYISFLTFKRLNVNFFISKELKRSFLLRQKHNLVDISIYFLLWNWNVCILDRNVFKHTHQSVVLLLKTDIFFAFQRILLKLSRAILFIEI